jgi:hypothetical protein
VVSSSPSLNPISSVRIINRGARPPTFSNYKISGPSWKNCLYSKILAAKSRVSTPCCLLYNTHSCFLEAASLPRLAICPCVLQKASDRGMGFFSVSSESSPRRISFLLYQLPEKSHKIWGSRGWPFDQRGLQENPQLAERHCVIGAVSTVFDGRLGYGLNGSMFLLAGCN